MHASSLAGRSQSATADVISTILGAFDPRQFSRIEASCGTGLRGIEVIERALRAAEIDVCRHTLETIRASAGGMDALKARLIARSEWRDRAKRDRVEWDGPMTMPR